VPRVRAEAHSEAEAVWERWRVGFGVATALFGMLTASTILSVLGDSGSGPFAVPTPPASGGAVADQLRGWAVAAKVPIAVGAVIAGVIAAVGRFLDPRGRAALHGTAGARYGALADETRRLRASWTGGDAAPEDVLPRLQTLTEVRAEIRAAAPAVPERTLVSKRAKAGGDIRLERPAIVMDRLPPG
jgi:hypothetical protein